METENDKRGAALATELQWNGNAILEVAAAALEEANYHSESLAIREMIAAKN